MDGLMIWLALIWLALSGGIAVGMVLAAVLSANPKCGTCGKDIV